MHMKVGFYQFRPMFGKIAANTKKIVKALNDAYGENVVVVADNLNQEYISSNVTDVACALDS